MDDSGSHHADLLMHVSDVPPRRREGGSFFENFCFLPFHDHPVSLPQNDLARERGGNLMLCFWVSVPFFPSQGNRRPGPEGIPSLNLLRIRMVVHNPKPPLPINNLSIIISSDSSLHSLHPPCNHDERGIPSRE